MTTFLDVSALSPVSRGRKPAVRRHANRDLPVAATTLLALVLTAVSISPSPAAEPRVLLKDAKLELVAREPDIVTPIGMAFDRKGRLLAVESHTHERPADYKGPKGDRIRMLSDSDGDGRLDRWTTFAEGFQNASNLAVREDGGVYLVTRNDLRLLQDTNDDGVADKETPLVHLDTEAFYPHNGLGGIMWDEADQKVYLSLGENFGGAYKLVAHDSNTLSGRGGVGTIFRGDADGKNIERWATGFWNVFTMCRVPGGQLFAVDNDPDSCPSSRLVHVVHAGDYGFRYEYGRSGLHPLQAWDGELPGTLPMVCGTGEAPTAIVAHNGYLWVTSWGDHRIERYKLTARGASFAGRRQVVVQGDADFRPTGMAVAPDGALYFGDWVDKSYAVHGMGKVWRLATPKSDATSVPAAQAGDDHDPFVRQQKVDRLLSAEPATAIEQLRSADADERLDALRAIRFRSLGEQGDATPILRAALADPDPGIRLYAIRWIADERIEKLRDDVAALLNADIPSERYYMGILAALEWLDGDTTLRTSTLSDGLLARELRNADRSPKIHALALRLISPGDKLLTTDLLREYLASDEPSLRLEAIRTLALQETPERFKLLAEVAEEDDRLAAERAVAIDGLAAAIDDQEPLLKKLAHSDDPTLAHEAMRVLRLAGKESVPIEEKPAGADLAAWEELLGEGGDPESGRRLFFAPVGPRCASCHLHSGRGGRVGPELTQVGRQQERSRIIASILQPSREVAPQFQAWKLATADGKSHVGLRLPKSGDDGLELYADPTGVQYTLPSGEIELRELSDQSIMPEGLEKTMSVADLRDLVAFLSQMPSDEAPQ